MNNLISCYKHLLSDYNFNKVSLEEVLSFLETFAIDVNIRDAQGGTLLFKVIKSRNITMVKYLIDMGADVNISRMIGGYTPLMEAVRLKEFTDNKKIKLINLLLDNGANTKACDDYGRDVLTHAIFSKVSLSIFKLLLDRGASFPAIKDKAMSLLYLAIKLNQVEIANFFIDKGYLKSIDDESLLNFYFYSVIAHIKDETVANQLALRILDEKPFKINEYNENIYTRESVTIIRTALASKNYSIIPILLEKGISINAKTKYGVPLIIEAIHEPEYVKVLTQFKDIDINIKYISRNSSPIRIITPLYGAISMGNLYAVKRFLEMGAEIDVYNLNGIHLSTYILRDFKDLIYLDILLTAGLGVYHLDKHGNSFLIKIIDLYQKRFINYYSFPYKDIIKKYYPKEAITLRHRFYNMVRKLINLGINLAIKNNSGKTAKDLSILTKDKKLISLLE